MARATAARPQVDLGDGWRAGVCRADDAFEALAGDWEALYARCPDATPFQSRAWLGAWWRQYGSPGTLRVASVHHGVRLVALGAFHQCRRLGVPVLVPLGDDLSDWTDVLVDPEHEASALDGLVAALLAEAGWQVLDLPEVRPSGVALRWADRWPGPVRRAGGSVCADLAARPLEQVVAAMPSPSSRQSVRRSLRKMDNAGLHEVSVVPAEAAEGVRQLLALHEEQWRERGGMTPEHGRPRFARFLAVAVPDMIARGQATLTTYWFDGQVAAANLMLVGPDVVGGYLYGARPDLFRRYNVTAMLMRTALTTAAARGAGTFSMLRGRETYKSTWQAVEAVNQRVLLGRPGRPQVAGYAAVVRGRARLLTVARTRAPAVRAALLTARAVVRNPSLTRTGLVAWLRRRGQDLSKG